MPKRSRKVQLFPAPRPGTFAEDPDPVEASYRTLQAVLEKHDPVSQQGLRVRELERVCREVAEFAKAGGLPERVIAVLERAGQGGPIDPKALVVTPEDFEAPAVAMGRKGGLKGGHARAQSMTKAERRKSAMQAAKARWAGKRKGAK
jgi:hypothetical protein